MCQSGNRPRQGFSGRSRAIREYDGYNEVRNRMLGSFSEPPASTSVGITLLSPETRIEIEGIAVIAGI